MHLNSKIFSYPPHKDFFFMSLAVVGFIFRSINYGIYDPFKVLGYILYLIPFLPIFYVLISKVL